jgi:alkaline phosphatase D
MWVRVPPQAPPFAPARGSAERARKEYTLPIVRSACAAGVLLAHVLAAPAAEPFSTGLLSRIAFGSSENRDCPQPMWDAIAGTQPDLFLLIGDSICFDTTNRSLKQATSLDAVDAPTTSPPQQRTGVYDARVYGPPGRRVQIILLDTRTFRDPFKRRASRLPGDGPYEVNPDRSSSMLGIAQWTWLRQQLRAPAEIRIIVSSIQVIAEDHYWEKWMNLPHERKRLFDMISDTEADNILFISGNRQHAELSMMKGPLGYPLYDLTSSPLNASAKKLVVEINSHGVSEVCDDNNFGLITVDWSRADPQMTLAILDEAGTPRIQHTIALSVLQADASSAP